MFLRHFRGLFLGTFSHAMDIAFARVLIKETIAKTIFVDLRPYPIWP